MWWECLGKEWKGQVELQMRSTGNCRGEIEGGTVGEECGVELRQSSVTLLSKLRQSRPYIVK